MSQFNKASMTPSWDASVQCVHVKGIGFLQSKDYQTGMNKGLELLEEKKATKWLADMQEQSVIGLADQDWTAQDWTPRAVKAGLSHSAFVVPTNVLTQLSLKRIINKVGNKEIVMVYFDNIESAKDWLRSCK